MILKINELAPAYHKLLILAIFLVFGALLFAETNTLTEIARIHLDQKFARMLFSEGDFKRSANEFQRLHAMHQSLDPQSPLLDSLLFQAAQAWRKNGSFDKSNSLLENLSEKQGFVLERSILMQAANFFNQKDYAASEASLLKLTNNSEAETLSRAELLAGCNSILNGDIALARISAEKIESEKLMEFISQAEGIKHKSPALAALMSTVIPGSGKLYTERYWDALASFLTVGFTAYHAQSGFIKDGAGSVLAWINTIVGAYFYVGNIYGSAASAKLYNDDQNENLRRALDQLVRESF